VLGLKTEDRGPYLSTINGGQTEVLGAFHLITGNQLANSTPMYIVTENPTASLGFVEVGPATLLYSYLISETHDSVTRTLYSNDSYGRYGSAADKKSRFVGLYSSYRPPRPPTSSSSVSTASSKLSFISLIQF